MKNEKNISLNPDYSSELNIESIISAPLIAASKANVVMVTGQTRFLLDYCFSKKEDDSRYSPVMIEMIMTQGVIDSSKSPDDPDYIKKVDMPFSVPLLCLVSLNSLAIDKVNVDFDLEITSMTSYNIVDPGVERGKIVDKKALLNGKISHKLGNAKSSPTKYKSQSSSRVMININAGPLPLPVGVLNIIDLYSKTIQPLPNSKQ
jgi:hypothetical protein